MNIVVNQLWRNDARYHGTEMHVASVFNEHFVTCEDCGRVIPNDEANYINDNYDYPIVTIAMTEERWICN